MNPKLKEVLIEKGDCPLVSVIVLNYNGQRSIVECLRSIEDQTYPLIETIVVDNASDDGSPELVKREFPNFKLMRNSSNLGFAEGNNVGIRASRGDFILLVNNDMVLDSEAVSRMVERMSESGVGILGGVIYYYGGEQKIWAYGGYLDPLSGMHWHAFQGCARNERIPNQMKVDYVPGAMLMVRRNLLLNVNLLSSYFFLYGDDIDLACKVRRCGYEVEVISAAKSYHMVSQSVKALEKKEGGRNELHGFYMMNKNMFYLYFSQLPFVFALSSTATQILFILFETLLFRRRLSYASVKFRALGRAFSDLIDFRRREEVKLKGTPVHRLPVKTNVTKLLRVAKERGLSRIYYW